MKRIVVGTLSLLGFIVVSGAAAQDLLPEDNGLWSYHSAPRYRETESHPLRILSYIAHPIGWVAREVIFRPFSYFAGSTEVTRSVMGFREPFDFRKADCFSTDDSIPDCRAIPPYNYDMNGDGEFVEDSADAASGDVAALSAPSGRQVFFPDVNFDFNRRTLNDLGKGRARQIAQLLNNEPGLTVVLEGHADARGSVEYNDKLALDRADAVRAELVNVGVDSARLSTVSFGKSQPVFSDSTQWAYAVNRRVGVHPANDAPKARFSHLD
jgi:outer membrane protein OmpA-like peptidoglycan-associated protein